MDSLRGKKLIRMRHVLFLILTLFMFNVADLKDKFDWDRYLESKELEAAPNFAFQHVNDFSYHSCLPKLFILFSVNVT